MLPVKAGTPNSMTLKHVVTIPVKSHGKKTIILTYALEDMIKKFDLPADVFD